MKKRKLLRNVSLVALSAVLVGGTAMAFTACGGNENEIYVYIFCNDADAATNKKICEDWAEEYGEQINRDITIRFENEPSDLDYYNDINDRLQNNSNVPDVMYIATDKVISNASRGKVLDLSDYILASDTATANVQAIWNASLAFFGAYEKDGSLVNASEAIYQANGADGEGFYDGTNKIGIYGLPKDYSNFALGYNRLFFTDEFKEAYTTTYASAERTVKSHIYDSTDLNKAKTIEHDADDKVVTYAVTGEYKNPYTGEKMQATKDQDAPLINIGVPTTYKPYNFYLYTSYDQALSAGDPMAVGVEYYTGGEGYTVTIPGFPGETFDVDKAVTGDDASAYKDKNAEYDTEKGYITFTYAEYGALNWALTYYLNTFAWDGDQKDPLNGNGGKQLDTGRYQNVYGGEQYEHSAFGVNGYLLPWLYSNDASLVNETQIGDNEPYTLTKNNPANTGKDWGNADIETWFTTNSETLHRQTLDGAGRDAKVQYGMDSKNFIETYSAFHNHGAVWNANSNEVGDGTVANKGNNNGWYYIRNGSAIFYGAGTWDSATRNNANAETTLSMGIMPAPVSEKLALYSTTRNIYYKAGETEMEVYGNALEDKKTGNAVGTASDSTGDYAQRSDPQPDVYTQAEIYQNQLKRQDKWGGRMDSVGYAANGELEGHEWKAEAVANLISELTINEEAQVLLTYGGAQLPNMRSQCVEFLNFQDEANTNGAFKDMITPEGSATVKGAEGEALWNTYSEAVLAMAADAKKGSTQTVQAWVDAYNSANKTSIKCDPNYANVQLKSFTPGDGDTYIAYSMRVLRMVNLTKADRDLNIRMQYGLNSARDQTMYTPGETWITRLSLSGTGHSLTYINQGYLSGTDDKTSSTVHQYFAVNAASEGGITSKGGNNYNYTDDVATQMNQGDRQFWSPAYVCIRQVDIAQRDLSGQTIA